MSLDPHRYSLTGYSLEGHLAKAFNVMHSAEINQAVTFNGAANDESYVHAA